MNDFFVSKCCRSEAQIVFSDLPDFIGGDPKKQRVGTCSFQCSKCGEPCDILPLEDVLTKEKKEKDSEWSLKITRISNGYLLEPISGSSIVVQDDEHDELKSHERLLWEVMEYFNFQGFKHDPERIFIVRKKQRR
jgi:hypothetical protein